MGFRINTNVGALNAHNWGKRTNLNLDNSLQKLSSGLRINKAADDASGMAIADSLKSQAMGLEQAIANANDGIGVVQTADGALDEYLNILNTVKKKAVQAASDGQSASTRKMIQDDVNLLLEEAQNIAATTSFNGLSLLNGAFNNKSFHIGAYSGETVKLDIKNTQIADVGTFAFDKSENAIASGAMTLKLGVTQQIIGQNGTLTNASFTAEITTEQRAGTTGVSSLQNAQAIVDEFNENANKNGVDVRAAVFEAAPNLSGGQSGYGVRLYSKNDFETTTVDGTGLTAQTVEANLDNNLSTINVTTREAAEKAIIIADMALGEIDTVRAKIGSAQNKLESTIRNISVSRVNVTAAESQIRDVDFAAESANFNKQNILAQSGTYAMSQANAVQQNVLRLLQ